ncbi:hypothetical protein M9458_024863, partial [Cirrhinus mrigala]
AARKGLDQAKEEGLKLHQSSDSEEEDSIPPSTEEPTSTRRPRKHKEKGAPSTRVSGRLRGTPADDISLVQRSPERGRRGAWMNSERMSQTPGSTQKSPVDKEVPEKLRSGPRGRGTTKESVSLTSSENQTVQTNPQLSDLTTLSPAMRGSHPKIRHVPSPNQQPMSPSSSVPSAAASPSMDKNSSGHQSSSSTACREDSEEQGGEPLSDTVQCTKRDRRTSVSSDSICSPEHHSEQDGQLPLSPTLASPNSRSPRKRQSAEREILKGLPEDSPSAKVLRKLPGRLVTVVEEKEQKEPKRRRRGLSGSGGAHTEGSSEETEQAEPVPDPASQSSDGGGQTLKDSPPKSVPTSLASSPPPPPPPPPPPQEQEQASSSPLQISPGKGPNPCSPTHHSPDMPVLRNLPVRRRLETESRMAAQLGEQFLGRGRGADRRSALSPKKSETNSDKDSAASSDLMKRKRGRPPKTPPRALELPEDKTPATQKTSPEQSPSHSPKRKRGRPRKDSTTTTISPPSSPSTCAPSSQEPTLSRPNVTPVTLPAVSNTSPISSPLNPTSPSNAAEVSSSPKPDSETNQKTTSVLMSSMHTDSENMSLSTSELVVDSHGETHTSLNPIIACIDSDANTLETSPHNTSTAAVSQICTASSPTLHPPSPLREPPTCTISIQEEELAHTPVLFETSEISASSEPSNVSAIAVETNDDSFTVNQQKDNLQFSTTLTQVTSQTLHRTSTTEDSLQTSVEQMCNTAASPTHPTPTQTSLSPALTSGIMLESFSSNSAAPEPSVTLTVSAVQQSTPKTDQISVPPSQPQTTNIEAAAGLAPVSLKISSAASPTPSSPNQITTDSLSTSNYTDVDTSESKNIPVETMADDLEGQQEEVVTEEVVVTEETEKMEINSVAEDDAGEKDSILSQPKRRKLDSLPKEQTPGVVSDIESHDDTKSDGPDKQSEEESREDRETRASAKKRSISRQSSQESVRSSSPSSVSSCGTRSSQSKKAGESRKPAKRKREDTKSEKEKTEKESDKKHQSNSSSSSSDSEDSNSMTRCLTRSAQKKLEKDGVISKNEESSKKQRGRSDKMGKTTNTAEGESSGETCSRVTRKSAGPQPNTLASPEPEVLGKRCSALNAAAKLLAMRGTQNTPSPRSKTATQQNKPLSSEKSSKPKGKTGQDSPKTSNSKAGSGRQTPNPSTESPQSSSSARSTRQRPGSLVPPLETERVKKEEKKRPEGEDENRETRSSGGHSACSSISSERGAGSSRSRSSSNSSQRTHSLSSQSTEPTRSHSRAASSGSDTERSKSIQRKSDGGRESRKEKRSQKQDKPELSAGSSDGTPDRVLRSVAALAAAQARTPASNTRSSSTQNRHSKT